jgi:hypothetical protein
MITVTLDTNCIIDLEENRPSAIELRYLLGLAESGAVAIAVSAIMASERGKNRKIVESFGDFKLRLEGCGMRSADILAVIGYWDITYWEQCYGAEIDKDGLEESIHTILFPELPFEWVDFRNSQGLATDASFFGTRWLNAKCDVLAMWAHIFHRREVFVTSDQNFLKSTKLPRLVSLGAGHILVPDDAVKYVQKLVAAV